MRVRFVRASCRRDAAPVHLPGKMSWVETTYPAGQEFELPDDQAESWINQGAAVAVEETKPAVEPPREKKRPEPPATAKAK